MATPKKITQLAGSRSKLIGDLLNRLENQVKASQRDLLETVLNDFLDGMETDEAGNIKNTLANKRRFSMFDQVFSRFAKDKGLEVVKGLSEGVGRVVDFNQQYYSAFEKPAILAPIHANVKETVNSWLGLSDRGSVQPNGYLDTLIKDPSVKNKIRDIALRGVISQAGYNETKTNLKNHIIGSGDNTGALERYYRNFAYDLYSVADRTSAKVYADKLKFNYAIYEGGLIETSREFCEEHNGKVYSREEIADFDPKVAKPPGYDPFTDLGGYGCRHHLNWVPDAVAFSMRPDLKDKQAPKAVEEAPKKQAPKTEAPKAKPKPAKGAKDAGSVYKNVTTKAEAHGLAKDIVSQRLGLNVGSVETHPDMKPAQLNAYLKQLDKLAGEYDLSDLWSKTAEVKIQFSSKPGLFGGLTHTKDGKRIATMNFGHKSDSGENRTFDQFAYTLRQKSKVDPENMDISTLTHEFAHALTVTQHQDATGKSSEFWTELKTIRAEYTAEVKKLAHMPLRVNKIYLGHYAGTNADEFFAEAFTEYKLSKKPSKYAKSVGKLVDLYFKKVSK